MGAWRIGRGAKESGKGKGRGLWVRRVCMNSQGMGGVGDSERVGC